MMLNGICLEYTLCGAHGRNGIRCMEMESSRYSEGGGNKTHRVVTWKVVNFSDIDALSSNVALHRIMVSGIPPPHVYRPENPTTPC